MLSGLKVVELANVLAGPSVGMFLAELGAEMIKIENPRTKGDMTRHWRLEHEDASGQSAYFSSVNWGKQHLFKDLQEDREEVLALIDAADILLTNYKFGDEEKFGLQRDFLWQRNPKLIIGHIFGFRSNPKRVAYDVVLQAESGLMSMNGTPESGPVKMPVALIDVLAAHQLKEGLLLALLQRERNGKGCFVEVCLEEAAISSLVNQASNYLMTGHVPQRMGSLHPNIAPYGEIMTCADGKLLVLAVGTEKQFAGLCTTIGIGELATDPKFDTNQERVQNREELDGKLRAAFANFQRDEVLEHLIAINVPCGAIRDMDEVFAHPIAQAMVLKETVNGQLTERTATKAFRIVPQ